jgi:hypothetical protein
MQSNFLPKIRFRCIMLYARFLPNFGSRFCKMDIFLFFKNVQNQKPPTNLDRPFFWDPIFGIYAVKKIKKQNKIYLHITSHFYIKSI